MPKLKGLLVIKTKALKFFELMSWLELLKTSLKQSFPIRGLYDNLNCKRLSSLVSSAF